MGGGYSVFDVLDTDKFSMGTAIGYKVVVSPKHMYCWDLIILLSEDPDNKSRHDNAENLRCIREVCESLMDDGDSYSIYPLAPEDHSAPKDGTAILCVTPDGTGWLKAPKHLMH